MGTILFFFTFDNGINNVTLKSLNQNLVATWLTKTKIVIFLLKFVHFQNESEENRNIILAIANRLSWLQQFSEIFGLIFTLDEAEISADGNIKLFRYNIVPDPLKN